MNNAVFSDVAPCGYARTDISEEGVASIFREKGIWELGTLIVNIKRIP
jgi:hypothetical protein